MFAERNSTTSSSVNKLYDFWQMSDFSPSNLTHLFRQLINFNKRWDVTCVSDCNTSSNWIKELYSFNFITSAIAFENRTFHNFFLKKILKILFSNNFWVAELPDRRQTFVLPRWYQACCSKIQNGGQSRRWRIPACLMLIFYFLCTTVNGGLIFLNTGGFSTLNNRRIF